MSVSPVAGSAEPATGDTLDNIPDEEHIPMKRSDVKLPAVRFIIHTVASRPDSDNNRYFWARITSTVSGRSMMVRDVGGEENARSDVARALESTGQTSDYPAVVAINSERPIKQWKGALCMSDSVFAPDLTAQMILDLENPA